jgi:hypothetical protein
MQSVRFRGVGGGGCYAVGTAAQQQTVTALDRGVTPILPAMLVARGQQRKSPHDAGFVGRGDGVAAIKTSDLST